MTQINASLVLYNNREEQVLKAVKILLNSSLKVKLYIVDNSSNDDFKKLISLDNRIEYIYNNKNLGYGAAHNIAIKKSIDSGTPYHLILNPDVTFEKGVLEKLYFYMEQNRDTGLVMPEVLYPGGGIQYLCKLIPTPFDLIIRRFIPGRKFKEARNNIFELRFADYTSIMEVPCLSGCFMFIRTGVFKDTALFDERFFMYMEDLDLSRRIHEKYKTIYYPHCSIIHEFDKGSYKKNRLLIYHIISAVKYFNKWGWFFDKKRKTANRRVMMQLKKVN